MPRHRRSGRHDAKPFDATTKHLLDVDPRAWLGYVGLPSTDPLTVVDADLSTVLAEADKVVRVDGRTPWLVHLELQASYDAALPVRLLQYNVLLHRRYGLPVASVAVLLRPAADGPALRAPLELAWPGTRYLTFDYRVVRTWEQPVESVLAGGLATLPLAPLADVGPAALPEVVRRIRERLTTEAPPDEAETLWAATYLLLGLRYSPEVAQMIGGLERVLRESWTYQKILREGRALGEAEGRALGEAEGRAEGEAAGRIEEARRILLRLATKRLGQPDAGTVAMLESLTDLERIERMTERLLDAATWADVLATP